MFKNHSLIVVVTDLCTATRTVTPSVVGTASTIIVTKFNEYPITRLHCFGDGIEAALSRVAPCRAASDSVVFHRDGQGVVQVLAPAWLM